MALLQSNLAKAKKLFELGKYREAIAIFKKIESNNFDILTATGVKDTSQQLEALSYLGLMHENGLGCKVDLAEARKYYGRAYHDGLYSAGISLAQIEYDTHHEDLAIALYKSIAEIRTLDDPMSKASAIYSLAKISALKQNIPDEAIDKLYDSAIDIYREYYPNASYYAEILYAKGQLKLKYQPQEAKEIFKEAADLGYLPAEIISLNTHAKSLFEQGNNEEAIETCDRALLLDSSNIDIKITKATILEYTAQSKSLNILDDIEEYDQALILTREIMLSSPNHRGKGYSLKNELENNLSRIIAIAICNNLKNSMSESSDQTKFVIDELGPHIATCLKQSNSLMQQTLFKDATHVANIFAQEILMNNQDLLESMSKNVDIKKAQTEGKLGAGKNLPDANSGFKNKLLLSVKTIIENSSKQNIPISEEEQNYISKRLSFQDAIQNRLMLFYDTCQTVLEDDTNIEIVLQDDSSYQTWNSYLKQKVKFVSSYIPEAAQEIIVAMAPSAGVVIGGAIIAASVAAKPLIPKIAEFATDKLGIKDEYDKKELLRISAKSFCDKLNFARRKDEYSRIIAEQLTRKYGPQIDKISQHDMRKLAHVAVKKMFNQIHNQVIKEQVYSALPKNFYKKKEENTVEFFVDAVSNPNNRDKFTSIIDVNPIFGGKWKVDDAFEKPAITINGKDFYTNNTSDLSYGCMYQETKPLGYKIQKDFNFSDRLKLEEDFRNNARRTSIINHGKSPKGQENAINEELREHRRNFYLEEKKKGKFITKFGAFLNIAAITIGVLTIAGLMGPFAIIPAAAVCIAGLIILQNGLKKDINASENLHSLDNPELSINREVGQQKQATKQTQIEGKFTKKFASKAKSPIKSLKSKRAERVLDREASYNNLSK